MVLDPIEIERGFLGLVLTAIDGFKSSISGGGY